MGKKFRKAIESILFAGMKPGAQPAAPLAPRKARQWLGPLRQPLERFLSGGASDDPLYLTNRTWRQRAGFWLMLGLPCLLVAGGVVLALLGFVQGRDNGLQELTPSERAAAVLPRNLDQYFHIDVHNDIDVEQATIERTGTARLVGIAHNRTDKLLAHVEIVFDLGDSGGSRVGVASAELTRVPPLGTATFNVPIFEERATIAVVREVHTK